MVQHVCALAKRIRLYIVEAPQAPGYWVRVPLTGLQENNLKFLTFYLSSIGFLSVLGGWLFARHLNRPLKALQQAAVKVGVGDFSTKLEEQGSTEVIEVTRAFNQMFRYCGTQKMTVVY